MPYYSKKLVSAKRERVLRRIQADASQLDFGDDHQARISELLQEPVGAESEYKLLAIASTMISRIDKDLDRFRGYSVRTGAKTRGNLIRRDANRRVKSYQAAADKIWARAPKLTKTAVANIIGKTHGGKPNTIRRKINKSP